MLILCGDVINVCLPSRMLSAGRKEPGMVSPELVALQIVADFPQDLHSPAPFASRPTGRLGPTSHLGQRGRVWGSAHGQVYGP